MVQLLQNLADEFADFAQGMVRGNPLLRMNVRKHPACILRPSAHLQSSRRIRGELNHHSFALARFFSTLLGHLSRIYAQCGNNAAASALANEMISVTDEKGASFWKAAGMIFQGGLLALTGKAADGVETITSGITAYRCTGATVGMPSILSILANAYAELGQLEDAWG